MIKPLVILLLSSKISFSELFNWFLDSLLANVIPDSLACWPLACLTSYNSPAENKKLHWDVERLRWLEADYIVEVQVKFHSISPISSQTQNPQDSAIKVSFSNFTAGESSKISFQQTLVASRESGSIKVLYCLKFAWAYNYNICSYK